MADIHDCALIATAGIAIDQEVTATLGPHMAQSHGAHFPTLVRGTPGTLHHPSPCGNSPPHEVTPPSACTRGRSLNNVAQQDLNRAVESTIATSGDHPGLARSVHCGGLRRHGDDRRRRRRM